MAGPLDLLLDSAAQLFADACTPELQESVEEGHWPEQLWQAVDNNGLPLLLVPEDDGGIGLGWPEATALLRLAGAFAVPLPLAETMLANQLLASAGHEVPEGPLTLAPLSAEDAFRLSESGGGFVLSGRAARVPWLGAGSAVDTVVVIATSGDEGRLHVATVPTERLTLRDRPTAAGEPAADIAADGIALEADHVASLPAGSVTTDPELGSATTNLEPGSATTDLQLGFALARSALLAGAMDRILDLTLEHAQGREQFGRPIAKFQAIQQQVAVLASDIAVVGAAVEAAAAALAGGDGELAVAATRARCGEAVTRVTAIAHQVHGAIGFTREHVLHRFTRRLWAWRDDGGSERHWQQRVGAAVAAAGAEGLWDLLCKEP